MIPRTSLIPVFVLAASSAVCAQDWGPTSTRHGVDRYHWRTVDANMSSDEYETAYRRNLRQVRNILKSYSKDALTSMGVPEAGINFMSAAVGLAVHDARFHLNKSKTLALELKDVANDDRTLFLGVKVDW
jgi:hypothetical protein